MSVYYRQEKKAKGTKFLSNILVHLYMIIHYIVEGNLFCHYYLQAFSAEEILKHHIKDCFKINGKQEIKMPKKGQHIKSKNFDGKTMVIFDLCRFWKCFSTGR